MGNRFAKRRKPVVWRVNGNFLIYVQEGEDGDYYVEQVCHLDATTGLRRGAAKRYYPPSKGPGEGDGGMPSLFGSDGTLRCDKGADGVDSTDGGARRYAFGPLKSKSYWADGRKHGAYTRYWSNGTIQQRGYYEKGMRDGDFKEYTSKGVCIKKVQYNMGDVCGERYWTRGGSQTSKPKVKAARWQCDGCD